VEAVSSLATVKLRRLRVERLGRVGHDAAMRLQEDAARRVLDGGAEAVFVLEHEPVYTLGRNASAADVLLSPDRREALGVSLRETDRGGKVTYHGPGQLVGYPVLNLSPERRDVKRYVTDLEETLIRTLADWGIAGERSPRRERVTSVWVGDEKIAAIGVHLSRWVTTHGFALNVTNEPLPFFRGIVPCGIVDGGVTSMERLLGRSIAMDAVADAWLAHFGEVFGREIIAS
jgi:lipoyl(octanoyl) transferase